MTASVGPLNVPVVHRGGAVLEIEPANGSYVEQAPGRVVFTFSDPITGNDVTASVTAPDGTTSEPEPAVEGRELSVPVSEAGPGTYEVGYVIGETQGATGFTVLESGQIAPEAGTSLLWPLGLLLVGAALGYLVVRLVRTWRSV